MTRIKTIGISLNVLPARLQRLTLSYRIAGSAFLLAVLLGGLLTGSCLKTHPVRLGSGEVGDFVNKGFEMENVRFEPQGLNLDVQQEGMIVSVPPVRASAYWLRRGDTIAPRWDTHEHHWERKGAMCGFVDNISTADCQVCDWCNPPPSTVGEPCMGIHPFYSVELLNVVADSGFIKTDDPQVVLVYFFQGGDVLGACANNTQHDLSFFEPAASGLYRFRQGPGLFFKGETNGEIKLHVVEQGLAQQTAYQLSRQTVDNKDYWTWTINGDPLWDENFSPNLRVTDIRILRGSCADGSAQGKQCAIPNESVPVKPSRILFLPNFQNTVDNYTGGTIGYRCYSAPDADDVIGGNFINLYSCRKECGVPDPTTKTCTYTQTETRHATPTYLADSVGGPRPTEKLTWVVEFDTNAGADADLTEPGIQAMPQDALLIIEFTIQAI
jgi:hypothetical protein